MAAITALITKIKAFFEMVLAFFTALFGGDSGSGGVTEAAMAGKLVTANIYGRALSAGEVALLYGQYR